jgi:uncharacterized protein (TIGR03089 family)
MGDSAAIAAETVKELFAGAVGADPARPLLTWYDDGTGERIELSGATLDNWVAKTANLLVDGCGLGLGDRATVLVPPHWQAAAVLLGCWAAGLSVSATAEPADALFATPDAAVTAPPAGDRFALGLAPLGAPLSEVPVGYADYVVEVRGYGDRFTPFREVGPGDPARHGPAALDHGGLCAAAADQAGALGIGPGARVLIDAARHPDPLDWLLAPLAAGATTVLCARLDPAAVGDRLAAERVTVALTAGTE